RTLVHDPAPGVGSTERSCAARGALADPRNRRAYARDDVRLRAATPPGHRAPPRGPGVAVAPAGPAGRPVPHGLQEGWTYTWRTCSAVARHGRSRRSVRARRTTGLGRTAGRQDLHVQHMQPNTRLGALKAGEFQALAGARYLHTESRGILPRRSRMPLEDALRRR